MTVEELMARVARRQLADLAGSGQHDWVRSAFYIGVSAAHAATGDPLYRDAARRWAEAAGWTLHPVKGPRFADNQACTQVYLDLYLQAPGPGDAFMLAAARAAFDPMVAAPQPGRVDWWWCDALFMAPPALARLATATAEARYLTLLEEMFWDAKAHLFSEAHRLFHRDARFAGGDTFWSRGNGWVVAGIARLLEHLPASRHAPYLELLRTMAEAILPLQGADGFWRSDLLHPAAFPDPETSGTGFFTYALAWGVARGALDRVRFQPAVERGWRALVSAVDEDGRLGWVQPVGHQPGPAGRDDSFPYGAGALLLAGSALLVSEREQPPPSAGTSPSAARR
jgi:unsaturated rhamnogalacturonyl hydrolase